MVISEQGKNKTVAIILVILSIFLGSGPALSRCTNDYCDDTEYSGYPMVDMDPDVEGYQVILPLTAPINSIANIQNTANILPFSRDTGKPLPGNIQDDDIWRLSAYLFLNDSYNTTIA